MRKFAHVARRRDGVAQVLVVVGAFGLYQAARFAMEPDWGVAAANARRIVELERALWLWWEPAVQRAFLSIPSAIEAFNVFYFVGHFVLTGMFFFWLYHRSRSGFRAFRDAFLAATLLSVLIHWQFPTAPPRLADVGLVDTLRLFSGIDIGSPSRETFSNPVAAVPSLHAGWALGVGIGLMRYGTHAVTRVAGAVYPWLVVLTIVVTGNHFLLDAVAGVGVLGLGFLVVAALRRRSPEDGTGGAIIASASRGGAVR